MRRDLSLERRCHARQHQRGTSGHAAGQDDVVPRLVSCLTAAERFFDQRWVLGEDRTPNRELAENQWEAMNRAAAALDALSALAEDDVIRLRARQD